MCNYMNFSLSDVSVGSTSESRNLTSPAIQKTLSRALKEGKIDQIDENKHGMNIMLYTQKKHNHSDLKRI